MARSPDEMSSDPMSVEWVRRLRQAGARLADFHGPSEAAFLTTGDRLRELHALLRVLSNMADTVSARLSADDFRAMLDKLDTVVDWIGRLQSQRQGLGDVLAEVALATRTTLQALDALAAIMSHIRVLAVNGRIEAAQLEATGVDFAVFTGGIARLSFEGHETITGVRRELDALETSVADARHVEEAFIRTGSAELHAVADRLAASLASLRQRQSRAVEAVLDFPTRLKGILARVAAVVSDLQINDITRQRLEHVEHALEAAAEVLMPGGEPMTDQQTRVLVNGICELQALQLRQTTEAFGTAVGEITGNLMAMAADVPGIRTLCERVFGGAGGAEESFLLSVDRDLEAARTIFARFIDADEHASAGLTQVGDAAGRAGELITALTSVEVDMRLIGLNASFKCGMLGDKGRALNVVARQLQEYAKQTQTHVATIAGSLDRVRAAAATITSRHGREELTDVASMRDALDRSVAELHEAGDETTMVLSEIRTQSNWLVTLITTTAEGFAGQARGEALDAATADLASLARDADPGLSGPALREARREVLSFMESRYTMASERDMHARALGKDLAEMMSAPAAGTAAPAVTGGGEPDLSDILF